MIRILGLTIAIFSTATLTTLVGIGIWIAMQGHVKPDDLAEIKAIVMGKPRPSQIKVEPEVPEVRTPGFEEITNQRVIKIMELENRQQEIEALKQNIELQLQGVINKQNELQALREAFRKELDASTQKINNEAIEQSRSIILKMSTEAAVAKLMALNTPEAITIIKGMSEKDAARILEKFKGGELGVKGNEIFQAITRGQPLIQSVNNANQQFK